MESREKRRLIKRGSLLFSAYNLVPKTIIDFDPYRGRLAQSKESEIVALVAVNSQYQSS